ncbi:hypothetical protein ACFX13_047050 [Malus domestica]
MCEDEQENLISSVFAGREWILKEVWKRAKKELSVKANILQVAEAFSKRLAQLYKSKNLKREDTFVEIIISKGSEHGAIYTIGLKPDMDEKSKILNPFETKPIKVEECYASIKCDPLL